MKKQKHNIWWFIGYILTWLIFFSWVGIWLYWGYNCDNVDMWMIKLWIWIAIVCFIFMGILHIVIFRMKWKTRELWINILKKLWKWIGIGLLIALVIAAINIIYGKLQYSKMEEFRRDIQNLQMTTLDAYR